MANCVCVMKTILGWITSPSLPIEGEHRKRADRPIAGWRIYKAYQHVYAAVCKIIHALQVDWTQCVAVISHIQ